MDHSSSNLNHRHSCVSLSRLKTWLQETHSSSRMDLKVKKSQSWGWQTVINCWPWIRVSRVKLWSQPQMMTSVLYYLLPNRQVWQNLGIRMLISLIEPWLHSIEVRLRQLQTLFPFKTCAWLRAHLSDYLPDIIITYITKYRLTTCLSTRKERCFLTLTFCKKEILCSLTNFESERWYETW